MVIHRIRRSWTLIGMAQSHRAAIFGGLSHGAPGCVSEEVAGNGSHLRMTPEAPPVILIARFLPDASVTAIGE